MSAVRIRGYKVSIRWRVVKRLVRVAVSFAGLVGGMYLIGWLILTFHYQVAPAFQSGGNRHFAILMIGAMITLLVAVFGAGILIIGANVISVEEVRDGEQ